MTLIYGLRELGTNEIRYVGFTDKPRASRLKKHKSNAKSGKWNYPVYHWMSQARDVEIVGLCNCPKHRARELERRWVERLVGQGHRLTNCHLSPVIARARQSGAAA